ncbi:antitoxin [Nocardiopsis algeriensis]|uniref:Antitoxin protein of toxin-antitoxin system n=1 Tax=Nocardiopsis algeriensis TaxID=1478215 RepID=A0A841IQZ7_9ACTN|nr:antitoxin [Nocardiopsis algeriensis]MBB6119045.1 hypothetical protein [Nocardiopsis algeriensis]
MAGAGDMFDRLKKAARDNPEKAEKFVDQAAERAKKATGGKYDEHIDKGSDSATDYLRRQSGRNESGSGEEGPR